MSKFDKIFEARDSEINNSAAINQKKSPDRKRIVKKENAVTKNIAAAEKTEPPAAAAEKSAVKLGRPPAKRSHPDFVGLTTYVRRETHLQAKIALLREGEGRELSELVEILLQDWLNKNNQ